MRLLVKAFVVVTVALCIMLGFALTTELQGTRRSVEVFGSDEVEPDQRRTPIEIESWEDRVARISAEEKTRFDAQHLSEHDEDVRANEQRKVRKVRRFQWESPAETRGKIWNVPEEESEHATLTAFLRICVAEADGRAQDCVGIWQVMKNIRRRSCTRGHVRRITECDDDGETMLSVMRRSQRHIMGFIPLRNKRAAWIRNLEMDCELPEGWTGNENQWDAQYGSKRCPHVVELGRYLLKGELPPRRPGVDLDWLPGRPITWGGRCESGKASCDDPMACSRGLARIQNTETYNAFWRRPRTPDEVDPICKQLGYAHFNEEEMIQGG